MNKICKIQSMLCKRPLFFLGIMLCVLWHKGWLFKINSWISFLIIEQKVASLTIRISNFIIIHKSLCMWVGWTSFTDFLINPGFLFKNRFNNSVEIPSLLIWIANHPEPQRVHESVDSLPHIHTFSISSGPIFIRQFPPSWVPGAPSSIQPCEPALS